MLSGSGLQHLLCRRPFCVVGGLLAAGPGGRLTMRLLAATAGDDALRGFGLHGGRSTLRSVQIWVAR